MWLRLLATEVLERWKERWSATAYNFDQWFVRFTSSYMEGSSFNILVIPLNLARLRSIHFTPASLYFAERKLTSWVDHQGQLPQITHFSALICSTDTSCSCTKYI
jgi:hypothetical protein